MLALRIASVLLATTNIKYIALNSILQKIVDHKRTEIVAAKSKVSLDTVKAAAENAAPPLDFVAALQQRRAAGSIGLIAEVKKASPSKGIIRADFDPVAIAETYAKHGAACISVLTDENFFQGHLDFLRQIRTAVNVPLLRKDFVLDVYQVYEARAAGADAVLLIAECLEGEVLQELHQSIESLGMTALVELYDADNIEKVMACNPKLVGVNNRDLNTFEVDLGHSVRVKEQLPDAVTFVSESGIFTNDDVVMLKENGVDAMLVGESLMRSEDIGAAVETLLGE
jgi:indole-3-glycerol phosphate synthase